MNRVILHPTKPVFPCIRATQRPEGRKVSWSLAIAGRDMFCHALVLVTQQVKEGER